jgi:flagellar protein FliS
MRRKLDDSVAANNAEGFAELLAGVQTISAAWKKIREG